MAAMDVDVSAIIDAQTAKLNAATLEEDGAITVDPGLLTVTDLNPIDEDSYKSDLEAHLLELATTGTQHLLASLFNLPTKSTPDGPLASLPVPTTPLPRAKPLPKPKAKTKWELFAAAKGINKTKQDRKVFDEERQEWVNRWGRDGKNRDKEEQWIHEVPDNAPDDYNPATAARQERKKRVAKNESQHKANVARSQTNEQKERKAELERGLLLSKTSTASLGKFDKKLEGDPKVRGLKRKFAPTEQSLKSEKASSLAILSKLDRAPSRSSFSKKPRRNNDEEGGNNKGSDVVNVRKAVRFASKGRGGAALGRELDGGGRGGKGKGRGRGR